MGPIPLRAGGERADRHPGRRGLDPASGGPPGSLWIPGPWWGPCAVRPPGSGRRAGPRGSSATSWGTVYRSPSPETTGTQPSDLCTMYRLIHDENAAELLRSRIVSRSNVSVRATRATCDGHLEVTRARTEFARRSFFIRAVRSWNGLPDDTRTSPSMSVFRRCIADAF